MSIHKIEKIGEVISYIEAHLNEKMDLDIIANSVCYSKYHLHRMFSNTVGITIHDYYPAQTAYGSGKAFNMLRKVHSGDCSYGRL